MPTDRPVTRADLKTWRELSRFGGLPPADTDRLIHLVVELARHVDDRGCGCLAGLALDRGTHDDGCLVPWARTLLFQKEECK